MPQQLLFVILTAIQDSYFYIHKEFNFNKIHKFMLWEENSPHTFLQYYREQGYAYSFSQHHNCLDKFTSFFEVIPQHYRGWLPHHCYPDTDYEYWKRRGLVNNFVLFLSFSMRKKFSISLKEEKGGEWWDLMLALDVTYF